VNGKVAVPGARRRVVYFGLGFQARNSNWKARPSTLNGQISPARQVPEILGHSDGLGTKRSLTTERLASPRR